MASVTITLSGNTLHHMGREPENAVSSRVAAAMLGVSIYTLQRWCRDGLVPFFRVASGHYRFLRSDIEAMRDGATNEPV